MNPLVYLAVVTLSIVMMFVKAIAVGAGLMIGAGLVMKNMK